MRDLFFLGKMLILTAVVALFMQVHLGEYTAENHFHKWLKSSALVDWTQTAVDGGLIVTKTVYLKVKDQLDPVVAKLSRHRGDDRKDKKLFTLKRSSEKNRGGAEELP